jgi:hypothetical protein
MKILYLTSPFGDFLADSLFHGLRSLYGADVVDFPRCDVMYRSAAGELSHRVHGRGFTLYGLLDELVVDRYDVFTKIRRGYYDLVVFSSIHRQFGWFVQLLPYLRRGTTIVIDGEDDGALYPYRGEYWRFGPFRWLPLAHTRFPYFKREWTLETVRYRWWRIPPSRLSAYLPPPRGLLPIAFSIPREKVLSAAPVKRKDFPRHIVDPEVAAAVGGQRDYVFSDEASYYSDLQSSRFGITPKRAGWDTIRHYEVTANGAVPCIRDLHLKPSTCAPHAFTSANSIAYRSWEELRRTLDHLGPADYEMLQHHALEWARSNTTVARALEVLGRWRSIRAA